MEVIQTFSGVLNRGFQGNIIYNMKLPEELSSLSLVLTYEKEHLSDEQKYSDEQKSRLLPILTRHLGRNASEEELRRFIHSMKTEIQLCLMVDGVFAGNVHMPGTRKEMTISREAATRGCVPLKKIGGMAKIIVNVFLTVEDETPYRLEVKGDFSHVETN